MEKKITRITRWLERCARACSARSWQSALLDMECAKAELDEARRELWSRVEGVPSVPSIGAKAGRLAAAASIAFFILLSLAGPLAVPPPQPTAFLSSGPSLEWVSTDERSLLLSLRKSLSDGNMARLSATAPEDRPTEDLPPLSVVETRRFPSAPVKEKEKMKTPSSSGGEFDTIMTLVHIGQQALRERESAIHYDIP